MAALENLMSVLNAAAWTPAAIDEYCYITEAARKFGAAAIADYLNKNVPINRYLAEREKWQKAHLNAALAGGGSRPKPISFPEIAESGSSFSLDAFKNTAIILTAGGEGERLKKSLLDAGTAPEELKDFTKATWPLDGKTKAASTLGYNLLLLRAIARALGQKLPVIVTMGSEGSDTARLLPPYLAPYNDEYLDIITVSQGERLHLTTTGRLVLLAEPDLRAAVNPDETGGPFMALKNPHERDKEGLIHYLLEKGMTNCLALQAIAIVKPLLMSSLAAALKTADVAVLGVKRDSFPESDPFGTIVSLREEAGERTVIVEAHNRWPALYELKDKEHGFLPYNSGMYAFKTALLAGAALPDFICPPKIITAELPPAGKSGYAATDLLSLSSKVALCLTSADSFAVFKSLADRENLINAATNLLAFLPHIY